MTDADLKPPATPEPLAETKSPATATAPVRRPYTKPRLTRYGNIAEITTAVGNMGASDNGMPPFHKTAP